MINTGFKTFIFFIIVFTLNSAQGAIGIKGGVNYTYYKNPAIHPEVGETWGVFKEFRLSNRFFLESQFCITHIMGNEFNATEAGGPWGMKDDRIYVINIHIHAVFLEFPFLLKFTVYSQNNFKVNITAGPSFVWGLNDKSKRIIIRNEDKDDFANQTIDYHLADYGGLASNGKSWNFGLEFIFRKISLEFRYSNITYDLDMLADLWFKEELTHAFILIGGMRF